MTKYCTITGLKCPYWDFEDTVVFCDTCPYTDYEFIELMKKYKKDHEIQFKN